MLADFTFRRDTGRDVQYDGVSLARRGGDGQRIRGQPPAQPAKGRDRLTAAARVDHDDADQARRRGHLGVTRDAPGMIAVAKRHRGNPARTRLSDRHRHGLFGDHLPETAPAVEQGRGVGLGYHLRLRVGPDFAGLDRPEILRNPEDAVGVVSRQVGIDQVLPNDARLQGR